MKNYKLEIEYDGRGFVGWQRQGRGRSVQEELEKALSRVCDHRVILHGSGRTDAGVHAYGQVANFFTRARRTAEQIRQGTNCLLSPDVAVLKLEEAAENFHARFSATGKIYEYYFLTSPTRRPLWEGRAFWVGPHLNWEPVPRALRAILGEHDFAAFQAVGSEVRSTVRRIDQAEVCSPAPDLTALRFMGTGFLRHMVRTLAGTFQKVAAGKLKPEDLPEILASKNRRLAGPTAPASGLYLVKVLY